MTDETTQRKRSPRKLRERGNRKYVEGIVGSAKMDKTVTVLVDRMVKHPKYKKYIRRTTKYYAHDEENDAREGDKVRIIETRPLSKLKRWRLVEVLVRAPRLEETDLGASGDTAGVESNG